MGNVTGKRNKPNRTPITYYGGKQTLADTIIEMFPKHKLYCEPYFGGGAVFFKKPKSKIEVINDHDEHLINFYLAVQNNFEELRAFVENTLHSEKLYLHAKDVWNERVPAEAIEKAWAVWYITNGSFNGSMHGGWKWCNGTSGSHSAIFLNGKRNSFNDYLKNRLQETQISCRDALKVIKDRDSKDTLMYLDPPYPGRYQGHYYGYSFVDFDELLNKISGIKSKFILSNYWSSTLKYHILKNGWNFKTIDVNIKVRNLRNAHDRVQQSKLRTEVLVYNFDLPNNLFNTI